MSDEDVHLRLVEVVAETAHGRIEIHANEHDIFEARHVLYNGGVEYLPWHPSRTFGGETAARRACLNFFENWKKEFALEYLAYRLRETE